MDSTVEFLSVGAAAFAPMAALLLAGHVDRARRSRSEKPPQSEMLLRPPGHSLSLTLESQQDRLTDQLLITFAVCGLAGAGVVLLARLLAVAPWHWLTAVVAAVTVLLVAGTMWRTFSLFKATADMRNNRLGLRGEQATAEALNEVGPEGFRSFHDVVLPDEKWNIDHVAVGTQGVFLIETKARNRHRTTNGKADHKVGYDGKALTFPGGWKDAEPIEQASRNARDLAKYLTAKTGEAVQVSPLVVMPGWFVEVKLWDSRVKVMNAKGLASFLGSRRKGMMEDAQARRVVAQLDQLCRNVEFE
jgi:hypothetical protein